MITMGGLTEVKSRNYLMKSSSMGSMSSFGLLEKQGSASSLKGEDEGGEDGDGKRRLSTKKGRKARFKEEPEPEVAVPAREGVPGSTFKSRMRDRETRQKQALIRERAETELQKTRPQLRWA